MQFDFADTSEGKLSEEEAFAIAEHMKPQDFWRIHEGVREHFEKQEAYTLIKSGVPGRRFVVATRKQWGRIAFFNHDSLTFLRWALTVPLSVYISLLLSISLFLSLFFSLSFSPLPLSLSAFISLYLSLSLSFYLSLSISLFTICPSLSLSLSLSVYLSLLKMFVCIESSLL